MHRAVALSTTWICASSPRPASLPETDSVSALREIVNALTMKCADPALAAGTAMNDRKKPAIASTSRRRIRAPQTGQVERLTVRTARRVGDRPTLWPDSVASWTGSVESTRLRSGPCMAGAGPLVGGCAQAHAD